MLATNSYERVLEADIEACFDLLSHTAILVRMRRRVGDKRVMMPAARNPKLRHCSPSATVTPTRLFHTL
jgi:retron-type reverse transcriptase